MRPTAQSAPLAALVLLAAGCSSGTDRPGPVVNNAPVTLQQVQAAVFTPSCALAGCHVGGSGAQMGMDLSDGASMSYTVGVPSLEVPSFSRVAPRNAQDSYIYMKITGDPRILGDPMPASGPSLSDQSIDLLRSWIDQGALP